MQDEAGTMTTDVSGRASGAISSAADASSSSMDAVVTGRVEDAAQGDPAPVTVDDRSRRRARVNLGADASASATSNGGSTSASAGASANARARTDD